MKRLTLVVLLLALQLPITAAGTVQWTSASPSAGRRTLTAVCVSDGSGNVSTHARALIAGTQQIMQVRVTPGSSGDQPSDAFDVTLLDQSGLDLLGGRGANLSNAAPTLLNDVDVYMDTSANTVDVVITNAGSAKTVTVTILVQL